MTDHVRSGPPKRHPHAAYRVYQGEAFVVLPQESGRPAQYKIMNEVGSRVWELMDGTKTVEEIAEAIAGEYEVDAGTARKDVDDFLHDLEANGMLAHGQGEVA